MKKTFLIILAASTVLISLYLIFESNDIKPLNTNRSLNNQETKKRFVSENLDFDISSPNESRFEEGISNAKVIFNQGVVVIDRNSTNFSNLDEYLSDLDRLNGSIYVSQQETQIGDSNAVIRNYSNDFDNRREYSIYSNYWIYNLYTDSPELYDELDQIAQSFKYLGD